MAFVYLVLSVGAVTTIYPFLLMASTGFKGMTDQNDNRLVPEFWSAVDAKDEKGKLKEGALLHKYLMDKYAGDASMVESSRIGAVAPADEITKYESFLMELPNDFWHAGFRAAPNQQTSRLTVMYQNWLRDKYGSIRALNRTYIEENVAFQTVTPPSEVLDKKNWTPRKGNKYPEWLEFKASLPAEFRIPLRVERIFQEWLRAKYQGQFDQVPKPIARSATNFETIRYPGPPEVVEEFRATALPERFLNDSVESRWNAASDGPLPIAGYESTYLKSNVAGIRSEFNTRNYRYVLDYIALNGRALWNTAIFCGLAILTQLIVNPLAAYALSRYPIRASLKILLFLLATMAFPAEVAMIPSFLLLKDLGLLNTFAALVLPAAASGYMIFLLKGFFDSLPTELFEASQLDGAKERTMLWKIALPLSRPVLGFLALTAFMGAYGAFLYAFVVCQDQRVWTLMVFIYQLQTVAPRATVMAALTLAAIPTIIVFLLAQRVIMRGIVLPGER